MKWLYEFYRKLQEIWARTDMQAILKSSHFGQYCHRNNFRDGKIIDDYTLCELLQVFA